MTERLQEKPQITLTNYRGFGRDLVELNQPVCDGFINTADIRANIVVVKKDPTELNPEQTDRKERVLNKLPKKTWQTPNVAEVRRDHKTETWYLGIDDDQLFRTTKEGSTKMTFDEQYMAAFQTAISNGLRSVLKREKLLNSEKYNETFIAGYLSTCISLGIFTFGESALLLATPDLTELALGTVVNLGASLLISVGHNTILNAANYGRSWILNHREFQKFENSTPYSKRLSLKDPFVKHEFGELIFPTIPFEKLIGGTLYLKRHQHELLKPKH